MNVLSLFDGMSCGRIALDRAGVSYEKYYASEIDKYAIKVSSANYPDTVQVGDIRNVKIADNQSDGLNIGLLIGGSPCQGFSFAGKQLNFNDPRSKLFFEFIRIKEETQPKYFLLENVKMKQESQDIISKYMGVEPIEIDSSLVSAQSRRRLYWTNIPILSLPKDKGIFLKDILLGDVKEPMLSNIYGGFKEKKPRVHFNKSVTLRAASGGGSIPSVTLRGSGIRKLDPLECERLQTVPEGYTEGVSNTQRYRMLGNGWTVDVIAHIFRGLLKEN